MYVRTSKASDWGGVEGLLESAQDVEISRRVSPSLIHHPVHGTDEISDTSVLVEP